MIPNPSATARTSTAPGFAPTADELALAARTQRVERADPRPSVGAEPGPGSTAFAGVALCFLLSGMAGLVYQTAWMRQFSIVFGTSEPAVATVLAAYMSGLALGAWAAVRFLARVRRPVLAYGLLEAGVGISALFVPVGLKLARVVQASMFGSMPEPPDAGAISHVLFYLITTFVLVLLPTAFMGATLPLLVRHAVSSADEVGRRTGSLYAINTAGAVVGALLGAFVLLPALGLFRTVLVGVALNGLVFVVAAALAKRLEPESSEPAREDASPVYAPQARLALVLMAVSGAISFTWEVLWTRMLSHVLGASLYAFAVMLASFLVGIALGSALASRRARTRAEAARGFSTAQFGTALGALLAWFAVTTLPAFADRLGLGEEGGMGINALVALLVLLPSTVCIGATFPFAVKLVAGDVSSAGGASARVYAWNTVGATIGALAAGFLIVPALEFEGTARLAVLANLALALCGAFVFAGEGRRKFVTTAAVGMAIIAVGFRPARPDGLLLCSPFPQLRVPSEILYADVGPSATVLVTTTEENLQVRVNGLPQATIERVGGVGLAGRYQRWLAGLPLIARPDTRSMLFIGFGGGVAAEALPSSVTKIDICELSPEVIAANRAIAPLRDTDPLADPRVHIVENDARSALALTTKRWDAIVSQPSHPWTPGASHLFTREFLELAEAHLTDGGVLLQWMATRSFEPDLIATYAATLLDVFEHVRLVQNSTNTPLFLASNEPLDWERRLAAEGLPDGALGAYFAALGIEHVEDIAAFSGIDRAGLERLAAESTPSTDDRNRLAARPPAITAREASSKLPEWLAERSEIGDADYWRAYGFDPMRAFERLLQLSMTVRASEMVRRGAITEPVDAARAEFIADALARKTGDPLEAARERFARFPDSPLTAWDVAALRLDSFASFEMDEELGTAYGRLPQSGRATLDSWPAFVRGELGTLRRLESALAESTLDEPWYRLAQQMRCAWRLAPDLEDGERVELAEEAWEIVVRLMLRGPNLAQVALRCEAALRTGREQDVMGSADYASQMLMRSPGMPGGQYWAGRIVATMGHLGAGETLHEGIDEARYHEIRGHLFAVSQGVR